MTSETIAALPALVGAAETLAEKARVALREKLSDKGRISAALMEREQHAAHGFSWLATYVEALRQLMHWQERVAAEGKFGEIETLILEIGVGEYALQIVGGIPMSQGEIVRPYDVGLTDADIAAF